MKLLWRGGGTFEKDAPRPAWPEFSPRIIPAWRETRGSDKLIADFVRGKTIP